MSVECYWFPLLVGFAVTSTTTITTKSQLIPFTVITITDHKCGHLWFKGHAKFWSQRSFAVLSYYLLLCVFMGIFSYLRDRSSRRFGRGVGRTATLQLKVICDNYLQLLTLFSNLFLTPPAGWWRGRNHLKSVAPPWSVARLAKINTASKKGGRGDIWSSAVPQDEGWNNTALTSLHTSL